MNFIVSARTDIGITKSTNQDSLSVKVVNTPMGRMVFAVLCDGMGGLAKGEVASASVVKAFDGWLMNELPRLCEVGFDDSTIRNQWNQIVTDQNQRIKVYGARQGIRLGTTVVAMLITQNRYYLLNVGDSRAYEISNVLRQLTQDQTFVAREIALGNMTPEQALTDERRNVLLQCVGASDDVYPDMFFGETNPNAVYMLCSDGFRHEISPKEIYDTQRDPNDRYQSAAELMYALEHYEEIDDLYRKKQKGKLLKFVGSVALTIALVATSVWGYTSAENKKSDNYDYILANAAQAADYYEAIVTDPTRTEAYLGSSDNKGLIEFLIADGELTTEENAVLSKLKGGLEQTDASGYSTTVKVLDELRDADPGGYQKVCYEIGEAYLFYYSVGVEKDKYSTAATWFQYATEQEPIAQMYCDISECLQNIAKFSKAEQYANLYKEYQTLWEKVQKLQDDAAEYDDDLKLRVWNEVVNMIRNNANEFCEVSSQTEIIQLLDTIKDNGSMITNTFLQSNIKSLLDNVEITKTKINSVKVDGTID